MLYKSGHTTPAHQPTTTISRRPGPVNRTSRPGGGAKHTHHPEQKNYPKNTTNLREGCPGKESLKPIAQDASRTKKTIAASRSAGGAPHAPLSASRAYPRVWGFGASRSLNSRGFTVHLIIAHYGQQLLQAADRKIPPIQNCRDKNPETPTNSPWKVAPLTIKNMK